MPPSPATLATCDEELPPLPVTRQFDFGQFVMLYHEETDQASAGYGKPPRRIVITEQGGLATMGQSKYAAIAAADVEGQPPPKFTERAPSAIDLFDVMEPETSSSLPSLQVTIPDVSAFLATGRVQSGGVTYEVALGEELERMLGAGYSTVAEASSVAPDPKAVRLLLIPHVRAVTLSSADVNNLIADERVNLDIAGRRGDLSPDVVRALLDGRPAIVRATGGNAKPAPVLVRPEVSEARPAASELRISDLPAFLAHPEVRGRGGAPIDVTLTPAVVDALRKQGTAEVQVGLATVRVGVVESSSAAATASGTTGATGAIRISGQPSSGIYTIATQPGPEANGGFQLVDTVIETARIPIVFPAEMTPVGKSLSELLLPRLEPGTGLHVALLVPWRQSWKLKGFSRGNLLQSLAMAPQEEITIQVSSWERRTGPVEVEQASESDAREAGLAANASTDTEDIFNELLARHDYSWQFQGSIDAGMGTGGITLGAGATYFEDDAQKLVAVASNSRNNLKQATSRASASVRAKRTTRVSLTTVAGGASSVVRRIRNPNPCRTLTFDFFEVLAHYEVELEFVADRLRLVVMVPNPITYDDFSPLIVRTHETSLMRALIEPALAGGFEALRLTKAYEVAVGLLKEQTDAKNAQRRRLMAEFRTQTKTNPPAEPIAEEIRVLSVLADIQGSAKTLRATADHLPATLAIHTAITLQQPAVVSVAQRTAFQRWLFIQLAKAKLPGVFAALEELATTATLDLNAARRLIAALPGPGRSPTLETLNDLAPVAKEEAGLLRAIRPLMPYDWDWPKYSDTFRVHGLYFADGLSIAAHCDQLKKAFQDLEVKREELEMEAAKDVLIKLAEAKQELALGLNEVAATADKLTVAFPFDDVARAYERQEALLKHLNDYKDHYNYALFQALPSNEQTNRIVVASGNKLRVGMFEPRVVAMEGSNLAVPLTSFGQSGMKNFVEYMAQELTKALARPAGVSEEDWNDKVFVPTPGVTMSSRLGACSTCEDFVEQGQGHDLRRREAEANIAVAEAARRALRNQKGLLGNPSASDDTTLTPAATDKTGEISANHGHVAVVTAAQQTTSAAVTLNIQGTGAHTHTVDLTVAELVDIRNGQRVVKTSSSTGNHAHTVTFN